MSDLSRDPEALLDALDPEQRQVAEALAGPVRVLAGAGTGKTRAITHRIAYGVAIGRYVPTEVLAVTFTTRAAGEMRGRLRVLGASGVQARTFHSAALRQLRYFWPRVHGSEVPELTESKLSILAAAARRQRLRLDQAALRDVASEIEWAKVSNVSPDRYPELAPGRGRRVAGLDHEVVGRLLAGYEDVKRGQGRMDMEDVLLLTAGLLAEEERVAAQVRRAYHWFVVDEYQDVSPIQSALLDLWLGGRDEICVVGDPAQTIYSFAGANADYLRDFPRRFAGTTSVELVRNYRSTPQVVAGANQVLGAGAGPGLRLVAQQPSGPEVAVAGYADEVAEATGAVEAIGKLRADGVSPGEIAILYRINAQSEAFEEVLSAHGVPYVVRGAARFFDRSEVRQAIAMLRGAAVAGDPAAPAPAETTAVLAGMGWTPEAPAARGQVRDRWESLQALVDQAAGFAGSLRDFVDELDRRAAEQHAPVADGVSLATFHAAKGLEWDAVFLCGLTDGNVPIVHAETDREIEEERRLLYVGMTRARRYLSLSWASARAPGGRPVRKPSRFLGGLIPTDAPASLSRSQRKRRGAAHCRTCGGALSTAVERKVGRCGNCPATYDEELYERLREWRLRRASEESVPAYVVFTDATLQLIAEHRPKSAQELLRINGIGAAKIERYSTDVLALLTASGAAPGAAEPDPGS
ncbi:MAG: ATP-dependent DNA helicase UvrD2 [Nocardioides sp.]